MKRIRMRAWAVAMICLLPMLGFADLAEAKEKILIKIGLAVSRAHTEYMQCEKFKEIVEKGSNGEIEVPIYPGAQLGNNA
ncbi:MAG: hypothetical protein FJ117_10140 [Deltaproteobacteria bacterium]|nr:hypothetical protein [Deltaproteobacteria bacterium]